MCQICFISMSSRANINALNLACWNINGLFHRGIQYSKLKDDEFIKLKCDIDILGLVEMHSKDDDCLNIPNYKAVVRHRSKANSIKPSGGIAVFYKDHLHGGIKIDRLSSDFVIWLRLCKDFFCLDSDNILGTVYLPPENSHNAKIAGVDITEKLENDIRVLSANSRLILMGDFNGRTRVESDHIPYDSARFIPSVENIYI